jgi:hypothetical protein
MESPGVISSDPSEPFRISLPLAGQFNSIWHNLTAVLATSLFAAKSSKVEKMCLILRIFDSW